LPGVTAELQDYKIVGNIPYYITGKLLRVVSELPHKPERVVLLIQKEVAERICAAPPDMNRLAASVQFWAQPSIVSFVSKKDFSPPPEVDSAVIVLSTKTAFATAIDPTLYYKTVRGVFAQPRKTIINNVAAMLSGVSKKEKIAEQLRSMGIDPEDRPQNLAVEQLITLAASDIWG